MNRRGFFGALLGGIAAATGLRRFVALPQLRPGQAIPLRAAVVSQTFGEASRLDDATALRAALPGGTDALLSRVDAVTLPGTAPWRAPVERQIAMLDAFEAIVPVTDLPEVWAGLSGTITATAALPPLAQVETLVELFGASGDAAPSFAAALIGELVLTRLRLADLRRLHAPAGLAL